MKPLAVAASMCALAASSLGAAREARADSGMCRPGHLVVTGERTFQVLHNCGAPASAQDWYEARSHIEQWVYANGEGSYLRVLTFVNGVLRRVEEVSQNH